MQQLARFGFSYAAGLLAAALLGERRMIVLFPAVLVGVLVGIVVRRLRQDRRFWCFLLAVLLALGSFLVYTDTVFRKAEALMGKTVRIEAEVVDRSSFGSGTSVELKLRAVDGRAVAPVGVLFWDWEGTEVDYGDRLVMTAKLSRNTSRQESVGPDYYKAHGLFLSASKAEGEIEVLPGSGGSVSAFFRRLRDRLNDSLNAVMKPDTARVASGMLLGGRSALTAAEKVLYSRAGISHLFCVSGLHLSIVVQMMMTLLTALRVRRRRAGVVGMAAVVGFMLLSGCTPAVMRSGVMMLICLGGNMLRRRPVGLNSLGIACLPIVLVNPYAMYDVGFLLSLSATLGIVLLASPLSDGVCRKLRVYGEFGKGIVSLCAVSLSAVVGTLPVTLTCFDELSVIGLLLNPVINSFVFIVLAAGLGAAFLGLVPFLGPLASACGALCSWAVTAITRGAEVAAKLPFATLPLGDGFVACGVGVLTLGVIGAVILKKKGRSFAGVAVLVVFGWCLLSAGRTALLASASSLSVVQTDGEYGAFFRADGMCVVYGGTNSAASDALCQKLRASGIREIALYFQPGSTGKDRAVTEEVAAQFPVREVLVSAKAALLQNIPQTVPCTVCPENTRADYRWSDDLSVSVSAEESPAMEITCRGARYRIADEWQDGGEACLAAVIGALPADREDFSAEYLVRLTPQEDAGGREGLIRGERYAEMTLVRTKSGRTFWKLY